MGPDFASELYRDENLLVQWVTEDCARRVVRMLGNNNWRRTDHNQYVIPNAMIGRPNNGWSVSADGSS
jgi:hypothetical protein